MEFNDVNSAAKARAAMHGRKFAGRVVNATYLTEAAYFGGAPRRPATPLPAPAATPPLPRPIIYPALPRPARPLRRGGARVSRVRAVRAPPGAVRDGRRHGARRHTPAPPV
jgi:hypothetical protein